MYRVIRCAGSAAGCSHPFACPGPEAGGHGAGSRQKKRSGGVNQMDAHAAGDGGVADGPATSRLAAGQEAVMLPAPLV
jgi:hypothetical protein